MKVWLALDPEEDRVLVQDREFEDHDFPPGKRGQGWETRTAEIDRDAWNDVLAGVLNGAEVDQLHRDWWTAGEPHARRVAVSLKADVPVVEDPLADVVPDPAEPPVEPPPADPGPVTPAIPPVAVAGLLVPAPLVPRIVAALRGTYPTLTAGMTDDQTVRAVLKFWIGSTLSAYEGQVVLGGVDSAVEETRRGYADKADRARAKALKDADAIREAPAK